MSQLLVKLLLAPGFVVAASLGARRYGLVVGGLIGALPVVAGPILLVFALAHGDAFAAQAATATLLGLVSLTGFVVVFAFLARRAPWPLCLLAGWAAFLAGIAALNGVRVPPGAALALAWGSFALALLVLPRPPPPDLGRPPPAPPAWDLPARAASALAMVLVLTGAAASLGAHLSGLLAPFPIIASILAGFTLAQRGAQDSQRLLRGLLMGFFSFALFAFTVAVTAEPLGTAAAFSLATLAALAAQGGALLLTLYAVPMRPTRPVPRVGDPVTVHALGAAYAGEIVAVDGRRVQVEREGAVEWFALSRATSQFVREGEAYLPRLTWPPAPAED